MRYIRIGILCIFIICFGLEMGTRYQEKQKEDLTIPKITSDTDELEMSVKDPEETLLKGLTASDYKDGDLTKDILVASSSYFVVPGVTNVRYLVFDKNGNHGELTRKVKYTDYKSPTFKLEQELVYPVNSSAHFLDYVTASDVLDGDITDSIKIVENNVDVEEDGVYPVTLEAMNSYGDTSTITLRVIIKENAGGPAIELNKYLVYLKQGKKFNARKYLVDVLAGTGQPLVIKKNGYEVYDSEGEYINTIKVKGKVNTKKAGSYQITYSYKLDPEDEDSEVAKAYLTVVVR